MEKMQEILHQKRENSAENPGFLVQWGQNCWKNVGNVASEEGNPVENPRIFRRGKLL